MRGIPFWYILAAALALRAPHPSCAAELQRPEDLFRAAFATDYAVRVERATAAGSAPAGTPARSDSYAFTSRRGTTGAGGKTYLRFKLVVREYADETAATNALRKLAGEVRGDLFVKWPLLAFTGGRTLYRLDGSCLYTPEAWLAIEERLLGSFTPPAAEPPPRLRVACGGAVEEFPAPAGQP